LSSAINKAYILGAKGKALLVKTSANGRTIQLPADFSGPKPMVIVAEIKGKPVVVLSKVSSLKDGSIVLNANNAKLTGTGGIKLKGASTHDPNRPNTIAFWTNKNDYAYWDLKIQKPGKYKVMINYFAAGDAAGSLQFKLESNLLNYTIPAGNAAGFKDAEAGVIEVSQQAIGAASLRLELRATGITGKAMPEISSITLKPM